MNEDNIYYKRVLIDYETLYVSRAQQRIIDLSIDLSTGLSNNNVDTLNAQLIVELQYSIDVLYSTELDWSADDIRMMIDYYTVYADLVVYPFRSILFSPVTYAPSGQIWATVPQLNAVEQARITQDAILQANIDAEQAAREAEDLLLWDAINTAGQSAVLEADLTSEIDLGGVEAGDVFVAGTKLEDIWIKLLAAPPSVSGLTFTGYTSIVEVGTDLVASQFTWSAIDTPVNLKLSDSEGILVNVPVTGTSYTPGAPITYPMATNKTVTWTLSGDNIDPITLVANSFYKSYSDKKVTATDDIITVSEANILAAANTKVVNTSTEIEFNFSTSNTEQGWIAVHGSQTGADYTKWFVTNLNAGTISAGLNFIQPAVDVIVGGQTYKVYTWGYRSPLALPLKLHR